jgi:hypothetical protein
MTTFASLIKRFTSGAEPIHQEPVVNPSEVLHINRDNIDGTLELIDVSEFSDNPSKILRVSWIKRDDLHGVMKTVWITDELAAN